MSDADLVHDRDHLETIVREAADIAKGYFGQDPKTWKKNDVSPVSEADLAVDSFLKEALLGLRPDYGWLSEETEDNLARRACSHVWIVDPIDGTRSFLDGKPEFTICAGLVVEEEPVLGVVINPMLDECFVARRGHGATLNGESLRVSGKASIDDASILARRNVWKSKNWMRDVPTARRRYVGSLAYQLCLVAKGEEDAAVSINPLHEWDIAAAGLIALEAGAALTDFAGQKLSFNKENPRIAGMICAGPALHSALDGALIREA